MIRSLLIALALVTPTFAKEPEFIRDKATVWKVIDGNTVDVVITKGKKQVRVSLAGIDAPELNQPFGQDSKRKLDGWIRDDEIIVLHKNKFVQKNLIGVILREDEDINYKLCKHGYAWAIPKYADTTDYIDGQKHAAEQKLGLWDYEKAKDKPIAPWVWRNR